MAEKILKNELTAEIEKEVAPYFSFDKSKKAINCYTQLAMNLYADEMDANSRKIDEEFDPVVASRSAKTILGVNLEGDEPEINGIPVLPFEENMRSIVMKEIWNSLTEDDFLEMNAGGHPVVGKSPVSIDELKGSFPVFIEPGVYQLLTMDPDTEELAFVKDGKSQLPYEFNYIMKASELKSRRIE